MRGIPKYLSEVDIHDKLQQGEPQHKMFRGELQVPLRCRAVLLSDCVVIGTHETDPTMDQCTDCKSFCLK